ncbi:MAG: UDP-galactopyranose mutase [Spirochaetes bacterium GWF1_51_8]|nr:MAG: UDP-galactopyranose mutase [Spirochaetes bacterium GWF1_51_8]
MDFDYIIVGAGFSGVVMAERLATEKKAKVLIIEKKRHFGGNCYDCYDKAGILIHQYGPHIFHTSSKDVWEYITRFGEMHIYHHRVLGVIEGKKVPIPFNLNTLEELFPKALGERIEEKLVTKYGMGQKVPILKLRAENDPDLKFLAEYVYEKIFAFYTEKQWGLKPEELTPEVTGRVPVYISWDDRYFQDRYQGMPVEGYTKMFERMLDHPNIKLLLNTDYFEVKDEFKYKKKLIYTGPVDAFFDYRFGKLMYRTIDFVFENYPKENYQEAATVNYPNDYGFTRISEFKLMTGQLSPTTTTVKEFSREAVVGTDELYYPMFTDEWIAKYREYEKEAAALNDTIFLGRLAQYRYYNMDQAILASLAAFQKL